MTSPLPDSSAPHVTDRFQLVARTVVCLALVLLGGWVIVHFLPALGWALILAIATWPLYDRARRRFPNRASALLPGLATLIVALIFLLPLGIAALQLGDEAREALRWAKETQEHGLPVPSWVAGLPMVGEQAAHWWSQHLADPHEAGVSFLHRLSEGDLIGIGRRIGGIVTLRVVVFAFTLVTLFFLYRDGLTLAAQAKRVADRLFGPGAERFGQQAIASVRGTVNGLVLVGLGEGVLLGIAYAVAGVPHPVLLGALTGVAAMIPFAAPVVFAGASLLLIGAGSVAWGIGVFAFGMVVLFIADHGIRPALIGGATRLPFLWVLLGILGGVETFGLIGLFIGPAVMAVLVMLWRDLDAGKIDAAV